MKRMTMKRMTKKKKKKNEKMNKNKNKNKKKNEISINEDCFCMRRARGANRYAWT